MFDASVYLKRRQLLRESVKSGLILLLGNGESPMNYPGNPYHFRQDSSFLYFFGQDKPGFIGLLDIDENKDYFFGENFTIDDIIWMGPQPKVSELAAQVGVENSGSNDQLAIKLGEAIARGRKVHFLPPYRAENAILLEKLLGISVSRLKSYASVELIKAVVAQREIKSDAEIKEMEKALHISEEMYTVVMQMALPGVYEREITGEIQGIAGFYGTQPSFPIILSIHGETLHNHSHVNQLSKNDLLVVDSGAESPGHYASDITRTFPVGGAFTPQQREIYQLVLNAQETAIKAIKPGVYYKDIHLKSALVFANGLKSLGLMKGNMEEAVNQGAHALFFPHGLGHQIGLDVHDMEDIGENYVGYDDTVQRSSQFGLAYLRMAKILKPSHTLTVEPGLYFIPALIEQWEQEKKFTDFIDYHQVTKYKKFGGIRLEDNVVVTANGCNVLGKPIPKNIDEIEALMT